MAPKNDEVTLVGPTGDEVTVKSPAALTNYVYGMGYKPKKGTVEKAAAKVAPAAIETNTQAGPKAKG